MRYLCPEKGSEHACFYYIQYEKSNINALFFTQNNEILLPNIEY